MLSLIYLDQVSFVHLTKSVILSFTIVFLQNPQQYKSTTMKTNSCLTMLSLCKNTITLSFTFIFQSVLGTITVCKARLTYLV